MGNQRVWLFNNRFARIPDFMDYNSQYCVKRPEFVETLAAIPSMKVHALKGSTSVGLK